MTIFLCMQLLFFFMTCHCARALSADNQLNHQVNALLKFRSGISTNHSEILTNWTMDNAGQVCSSWGGIKCNSHKTGITEIDLSARNLEGFITPSSLGSIATLQVLNLERNFISGSIPPDFGQLSQVQVLRLGANRHGGYAIPKELGNCSALRILDLRDNALTGEIPPELCRCTGLQEILLASNELSGFIPSEIGNLRDPRVLALHFNNLGGDIPESLSNCSMLESLEVESNGTMPGEFIGRLKKLKYLSLNGLRGKVPDQIGNCSELHTLIIHGDIEETRNLISLAFYIPGEFIGRLTKLKYLSIWGLRGKVPDQIGNCSELQTLDIWGDEETRNPIPLSFYKLQNLTTLSWRALPCNGGTLSPLVANLTSLKELLILSCGLHGTIPGELMYLTTLSSLDLTDNAFHGEIPPDFLRNMTELNSLSLGMNSFQGEIPHGTLSNLPALEYLDLGQNRFHGVVPSLRNQTTLSDLRLGDNLFTGKILRDITHMKMLDTLDLENNNFREEIPEDVLRNLTSLNTLSLGNNEFEGELGLSLTTMSNLESISLSRNNFRGSFPRLNDSLTLLRVIDLSNNHFSGQLPSFLEHLNQSELVVLHLGSNSFTGSLMSIDWLWSLPHLRVLVLSDNAFEGCLPKLAFHQALQGFKTTADLIKGPEQDIFEGMYYSFSIPVNLPIKGHNASYSYLLPTTILLDLSKNLLSGELPSNLADLTGLRYLDLSHNNFTGEIPSSLGSMKQMEELDLSFNGLNGSIPTSLTKLDSLAFFNVSYNQLEGRIPTSPHFDTFDTSSFTGNAGLCGLPPFKLCESEYNQQPQAEDSENFWDKNVSPVAFALFFLLSFFITMWLGLFKGLPKDGNFLRICLIGEFST